MIETLIVERRFRGPESSGNGGYSAGLLAELLPQPTEVTLRRPPPLDRPMRTRERADGDGGVELLDDDTLVAEATTAAVDLVPPATVSFDEAVQAAEQYAGLGTHPFPGCFTCGPARSPGDGLRIFPGPVAPGVVAAPWVPDESLCVGGFVRLPVVWAALDCPGAWAGEVSEGRPAVLGRLAVDVRRPVAGGERLVALGWTLEDHPRKFLTGTALLTDAGEVCAVGRATWVRIGAGWADTQPSG